LSRFSLKYFPRASRSGDESKRRSVNGRDLGPMNGRQPMVTVTPATTTTTSNTNNVQTIFRINHVSVSTIDDQAEVHQLKCKTAALRYLGF
jgi:hypothetical protein